MRSRQPAVSAGAGEGDCLVVLPPTRSPARASTLARTTSGSRGSGGRTSGQRCSRRTLGRWIRICCTVSHLLGRPSHLVGPVAGSPALVARLLRERYGSGSPWRVTRRCPPGGISRRGDRSPEGANRAGWGAVSGDQAQLAVPSGGLGPVGGAELAQDVGHVGIDRVERQRQVAGGALVGPARG